MREIKFRVRDGNTKEIIGYENFNTSLNSGYYYIDIREPVADSDGNVDYICRTEYSEKPMLRSRSPLALLIRDQYTGLKDCNGVDIYEGDIVDCELFAQESGLKTERHIGAVVFNEFEYAVEMDSNFWPLASWKCVAKAKVIGNIHENPELLEVSE